MSVKQEIIESLAKLPDEATLEDIKYHLYVVLTIKGRLAEKNPQYLTQEEVEERMKRWLE